ncbi:RNA polymerase sigma factor [Roseateles sp. LYH14W]|uniref:RNA polymerase sigma factor n=1 Tax=Pelomonas parva TaxID=3299032 RepID=A0ABW7FAC6_9BURK
MDAKIFLERMEKSDPTVFGEVMEILRPMALSACHALRFPYGEQEDIVQDVALKVFRKWRTFRAQSKLSTWIYAIAYRHCLDLLQKKANEPVLMDPQANPSGDGEAEFWEPDPSHGDPDHQRCIQAVLAELDREPPARVKSVRKIVLLRFWVEMDPSMEELAEFLETTVAAAKERKRYVWAHLKSLCAKHCGTVECGLESGMKA